MLLIHLPRQQLVKRNRVDSPISPRGVTIPSGVIFPTTVVTTLLRGKSMRTKYRPRHHGCGHSTSSLIPSAMCRGIHLIRKPANGLAGYESSATRRSRRDLHRANAELVRVRAAARELTDTQYAERHRPWLTQMKGYLQATRNLFMPRKARSLA